MAIISIERMKKFMDIPKAAELLLTRNEKEIKFSISLKLKKEEIIFCEGYVVYHNVVLGPAKGGIRISPEVDIEETKKLATIMTYKNALAKIPFGGGKSGIKLDTERVDDFTRISIIKEFVHMIKEELEFNHYIPAPDLGSGPVDMAVIYGELHRPECVTGKPVRIGGLPGRREATGRGVAKSVFLTGERILKKKNSEIKVAIQGFGNVGRWTAYFLHKKGVKIVGVSDKWGGIYNENGIDIEKLFLHSPDRNKTVAGFPEAEDITNEELFTLDVDILIPAAIGGVVNERNAEEINAKVIVEGANDPVSEKGEKILYERGIPVLPDFFCNSGGVIASYIEWRNAKSGNQTEKEEVFEIIDKKIEKAFEEIEEIKGRIKGTYREAAMYIALTELIEAMRERAWL
ncbi:Glu/Leu/Phe/Val dehydrogenase [bacterium]|nr:Glu/Leu/Phe/Val dehydrogenase [bacterium]